MRDYYKIESVLLDDISRNINSEKTSFTQGARKTFSNSYLKTCSDTSIKLMSTHLEDLYSKINSGYNSLSTWLTDYTNDAKNVEKGLSSSGYNVTDLFTNITLKTALKYKDVKVNQSPNVIDPLTNNKLPRDYSNNIGENSDSGYATLPYDENEKDVDYKNNVNLDLDNTINEKILEARKVNLADTRDYSKELLNAANLVKQAEQMIAKLDEELEKLKLSPTANADLIEKYEKIKADITEQLNKMKTNNDLLNYADLLSEEELKDDYNQLAEALDFKDNMTESERLVVIQNSIVATEGLISSIKQEIEDTENKIGTLEDEKEIERLENKVARLKELNDLLVTKDEVMKIHFPLYEYGKYLNSDEYKKFIEEYKNTDTYNPKDCLSNPNLRSYYDALADYEKNGEDFTNKYIHLYDDYVLDIEDFIKYATEEEKNLYHYLAQKKGNYEANKYLEGLIDRINQSKGLDEFYHSEMYELLKASMQEDGILKDYADFSLFFDVPVVSWYNACKKHIKGFFNLFSKNTHKSSEDYANDYYQQFLKYAQYGGILEFEAMVGDSAGTVSMVVLETALTRNIALGFDVPEELLAAYSEFGGTLGTGLSAMGNAKAYAMQTLGLSEPAALGYGFITGLSESSLQYFLGYIPFLNESLDLSQIAGDMIEEGVQPWVEAFTEYMFTGKPIDFDSVTLESIQGSLFGAFVSYSMGNIDETIRVLINGKEYEINLKEIFSNIEQKELTEIFEDGTFEDVIEFLGEDVYQDVMTDLKVDDYNSLLDKINNNPESARIVLRLLYSDFEISEMFRTKSNDEIVNNYFWAKKRAELLDQGYTRSKIDAYMRYYDPKTGVFSLESAVENGYSVEVNGIVFVSDSYEGVQRLQKFYEEFYNWNDNKELMKSNIAKSLENGKKIYITDLDLEELDGYCSNYHGEEAAEGSSIINLGKNTIDNSLYSTLTHELGHHLRHAYIVDQGITPEMAKLFEDSIKDFYDIGNDQKEFNDKKFGEFKEDFEELRQQFYDNCDTIWAEDIKKEVDSIIKERYNGQLPQGTAYDYEYRAIKQQIEDKYYSQMLDSTGYSSLSDIYDALGYEAAEIGLCGHGKEYYQGVGGASNEIAANLTDLYFNRNWDLVKSYFPPETVAEWEKIIMEYIK